MPILSARHLVKSYNAGVPVLQGISLEVNAGEIVGIVGVSGSGKTTLIRVLAGLLEPEGGEVIFDGKQLEGPATKLVPGHPEIRLVHQDFQLFHRMTVAENLHNALLAYTRDYRQSRSAELLKLCGLQGVAHHYVHELSGGEKQRVAIGMALATEPAVLLLDEPFSNLDFHRKHELLELLPLIAAELETAIVLISHDTRDAMEVAHRLVVLDKGVVLAEGTPAQLYRQPKYARVAGMFGVYNHLHRKDLSLWGNPPSPHSDHFGIWPENVSLNDSGVQAKVIRTVFLGASWRIQLELNGFQLFCIHTGPPIDPDSWVSVDMDISRCFELDGIC